MALRDQEDRLPLRGRCGISGSYTNAKLGRSEQFGPAESTAITAVGIACDQQEASRSGPMMGIDGPTDPSRTSKISINKQEVGKRDVLGQHGPTVNEPNLNRLDKGKAKACDLLGKQVPASFSQIWEKRHINETVAAESKKRELVAAEIKKKVGNFGNPGGSWANKVRASSAKSRFSLDGGFVQEQGRDEYLLPDELVEENFDEWTRCLVGFIPGSSFPFHAARAIALREWKQYDIESVNSYESFFIFRFHSEEKVQEVLADGPWLFGGKFMMLQQWHSCFVFDKSKITKVPVWIKLKGLPFTLWSHKALSFVASIVGKPLSCDRATYEKSRLSYARVCVEVDANKPYVHNFVLKCKLTSDPIKVGVDYEWKPQRCPTCCVYGHNCEARTKEELQDTEVQKRYEAVGNLVHQGTVDEDKTKPSLIDALLLASKPVNLSINKVTAGDAVISAGLVTDEAFEKKEVAFEEGEPLTSRHCAIGEIPKEQHGINTLASVTGNKGSITDVDRQPVILMANQGPDKEKEDNISVGKGRKEGLTTPDSKDNKADKGKAIASVDEISGSVGSWADKLRPSPNDPGSAATSEGSTTQTGTYNLRPQRPNRKDKARIILAKGTSLTAEYDTEIETSEDETLNKDSHFSIGEMEQACGLNATASLGSSGFATPKNKISSGVCGKDTASRADSAVDSNYSFQIQRQKKKGKKKKGVRPSH